jgi:hypothetical protein
MTQWAGPITISGCKNGYYSRDPKCKMLVDQMVFSFDFLF